MNFLERTVTPFQKHACMNFLERTATRFQKHACMQVLIEQPHPFKSMLVSTFSSEQLHSCLYNYMQAWCERHRTCRPVQQACYCRLLPPLSPILLHLLLLPPPPPPPPPPPNPHRAPSMSSAGCHVIPPSAGRSKESDCRVRDTSSPESPRNGLDNFLSVRMTTALPTTPPHFPDPSPLFAPRANLPVRASTRPARSRLTNLITGSNPIRGAAEMRVSPLRSSSSPLVLIEMDSVSLSCLVLLLLFFFFFFLLSHFLPLSPPFTPLPVLISRFSAPPSSQSTSVPR